MFKIGLIIQSILYIVAGSWHFVKPGMYLKIIPPYIPAPLVMVYLSGLAEVALGGLLLVADFRRWAAWGIILLLIAVFPANLYMAQKGGAAFGIPQWTVLARLPMQALLIYWAWIYTR